MSEFLAIDGVLETELPSHASDGREGDRVGFLEAGLLYVEEGRAIFARWGEILGALEEGGSAYVLVPRVSPRPPWIEVKPELLGDEPNAVASFLQRLRDRGRGGYREAVRRRREGMDLETLTRKVRAHEDIPGALEVPSTVYLGSVAHPLEGMVLGAAVMGGGVLGYAALFGGIILSGLDDGQGAGEAAASCGGFLPVGGAVLGGFAAIRIRKRWRALRQADLPRQRVLVLAPDGCLAGFRSGVRALDWAEVGSFEIGLAGPEYERGLIVRDVDGDRIGDIAGPWLDARLELVVEVAETYREAAL